MTGPKQVGGGPLHPDLRDTSAQAVLSSSSSTIVRPQPTLQTTSQTSPAASRMSPPAFMMTPGGQASRPPTSYTPSSSSIFAPPKRTYPLPPPFLLVAFKESPTEKFLLPLGSQSFISRLGGDVVTDPPPQRKAPSIGHIHIPASTGGSNAQATSAFTASNGTTIDPTTAAATITVPHTASEILPAQPDGSAGGRGRGRTRASLPRTKIEPVKPVPEPVIEVEPDITTEEPVTAVSSNDLPALPGMKPTDGTVLISTVIPAQDWKKPDWSKLRRRLPFDFYNLDKMSSLSKQDLAPSGLAEFNAVQSIITEDSAAGSALEPEAKDTRKLQMLNLGAETFQPIEGDLHAVTIRLEGLNDRIWRRMQYVTEEVERVEMITLGEAEPDLLDEGTKYSAEISIVPPSASAPNPVSNIPTGPPNPSRSPMTRLPALLRSTFLQRKRSRFQSLLKRAPPRPFLRYRLPTVLPSLVEATSDRWVPRSYPLSTKPLYSTDGADLALPLPITAFADLEGSKKRRRNEIEPEVTFEMPVSLDALDERVAEGAMREMSKGKRGRGKGNADDGRKRSTKRIVPGRVCEGCAGHGLKVWRRGPGGKGTRE